MAQPIKSQFSNEDYQLIDANELGAPIAIYRIKFFCLQLLRASGLLLLILGISELTFILTMVAIRWHEAQVNDPLLFFIFTLFVCLPIFSLLAGLFILRFELPRVQSQHIIICERGLLQMKQRRKGVETSVLYWRNVLKVKRFYYGFYIIQQGDEVFTLDILYQKTKEIVALIKMRSGKV